MEIDKGQRARLDEGMSRFKRPNVEPVGEGHRLSIDGLPDFEVFAETSAELWAEWRELLESHLMSYVRCGQDIPMPAAFTVITEPSSQPSTQSSTANGFAISTQWITLSADFARANADLAAVA